MNIDKLSMFANLKEKMAYTTQRQNVLAQNIANADTPNFRPDDLKEFDPAKIGGDRQFQLAMATTVAGHSEGLKKPQNFKDQEVRKNYEVAPGKNAVILEEQLVKMNENRIDYQTMTRLYTKHSEMIKTAAGRAG
ncbi:flagellar basal body protein [Thalassospira sp.]|uniref:flagellar basal body protein n=1 Tax=Thalassospira sp. TaxID=1912094 RepID=UPI002734A640|nr:flagellar basal body protein [Thalassospira sp.]MDP2696687.1 flagellar basal body protein [Thalassospira sp.]